MQILDPWLYVFNEPMQKMSTYGDEKFELHVFLFFLDDVEYVVHIEWNTYILK